MDAGVSRGPINSAGQSIFDRCPRDWIAFPETLMDNLRRSCMPLAGIKSKFIASFLEKSGERLDKLLMDKGGKTIIIYVSQNHKPV